MKGRNITGRKAKSGASAEFPASLFLKKEMVATAQKAVVYDLENEYRGTRKNRGLATYLSLAAFTALLLAGTSGITSYIDQGNKKIAIGISDFEDINMQELMYSLRNAGKLLNNMKQNMEQLKGQMGLEMYRIRQKAQDDLDLLNKNRDITEAQRIALMQKVVQDRENRITEVQGDYDAQLKAKEKSIEDVKVQMSTHKVQLQEKMDAYTGEMEKKLKEYQSETKASKANAEQLVQKISEDYTLRHEDEKKDFEKKLRELQEKKKDLEDSLKAKTGEAGEAESLLAFYRRALMHYAFMRGEQGHVIYVQEDGGLLVVLNPLVEMEKPGKGLVLNSSGDVIARIEIIPKEGMARARVVHKLSDQPISPFDMIVVQKE